jgi:hypothetical protein
MGRWPLGCTIARRRRLRGAGEKMLQIAFTWLGAGFLAFAVGLALWVDRREASGPSWGEREAGGSPPVAGGGPAPAPPRLRLVPGLDD